MKSGGPAAFGVASLALALSFAFAPLLGCSTSEPAAKPGPHPMLVEQGRADYQAFCASCHGLGGRGDGPAAPALNQVPADLTGIAARRGGVFPDAEIATTIDGRFSIPAHGSREMPIWGVHLGEDMAQSDFREEVVRGRILSLIDFLKTLQEPPLGG